MGRARARLCLHVSHSVVDLMPYWPPLAEYLAERDALEAEDLLLDAGIERTQDLLELTVEDLASLGVSAELQWKLTGSAPCVDVDGNALADVATDAAPKVKKRAGPAASLELEGFLEKHGLSEVTPLLVELGIQRFSDLEALTSEQVEVLGLAEHLQSGLLRALGMADMSSPPVVLQQEVAAPVPTPPPQAPPPAPPAPPAPPPPPQAPPAPPPPPQAPPAPPPPPQAPPAPPPPRAPSPPPQEPEPPAPAPTPPPAAAPPPPPETNSSAAASTPPRAPLPPPPLLSASRKVDPHAPAPSQAQPHAPTPASPPHIPKLGLTRVRAVTAPPGPPPPPAGPSAAAPNPPGEDEGIGAVWSASAKFLGDLIEKMSPRGTELVGATADIHAGGAQVFSAELGGPVELGGPASAAAAERPRRDTAPPFLSRSARARPKWDQSRPALLMSESSNDMDELMAKMGTSTRLNDLLDEKSFIAE